MGKTKVNFNIAAFVDKGDTTYGITDSACIEVARTTGQQYVRTEAEDIITAIVKKVFSNLLNPIPYPEDGRAWINEFQIGKTLLGIVVMYIDTEDGRKRLVIVCSKHEIQERIAEDGQHRHGRRKPETH